MSSPKDLPTGRLGRLARLAGTGLRAGAGLLADRDGTDTAAAAARTLGQLRGVATKVGQMAGYVDGVVPEKHRAAYEHAMASLRASTPTSDPAKVRDLVEEELGDPIDRLFAEWESAPFASASIGQVHRARLLDGTEVAVKVQHPGITQAIEADLSNAGVLETFAGALGLRRFDSKTLLGVIRERLREELDYDLEARQMGAFRQVHAEDPDIVVPRAIADRSSKRVLTAEFVRGTTFEEACKAPVATRQHYARTLWRFVFKGNTVGGRFNADPHPGNYVFLDERRIAFLDYGCIQPITEGRLSLSRRVHKLALAGDRAAFREAARTLVGAKPGPLGDRAIAYLEKTFAPVFESPFRITREFSASLPLEMKEMAVQATRTPDEEFFTMAPESLFMNRLHFGFYSVLARLDVEVDYAAVERAYQHLVPEGEALPPGLFSPSARAPR